MPGPSISTQTDAPDKLLAGDAIGPVTREVTLITGENLTRGAVLGKIAASGKYNLSLSAAVDGSQVPVAILVEAADATAADKQVAIFEAGIFNEDDLTLGAAHTIASIRAGLRDLGIHLKSPIKA